MLDKSSETIPKGSRDEINPETVETLVYFYVLKDPRCNTIRYVGRTVNLKNRFNSHVYEAKTNNRNKRERWIVSLLRKNLKPVMSVVYQNILKTEEAILVEKMLIRKFKKKFDLLNQDDRALGGSVSTARVYQYNTEDGSLINSFQNAHVAGIMTGIKDCNISRCCKNENGFGTKTAGGYFWSFINYKKYPYKFIKEWRNLKGKPVLAVDPSGSATEFISAREAEKATGVSYKLISACANGKQKTAGGYTWKFKC